MADKRYSIEVYLPTVDNDHPLWFGESETPFLTIATGDLINSAPFGGSVPSDLILEVRRVEHLIWETSAGGEKVIKHKLMVFTNAIPDTRVARTRTDE